MVDKKNLYGADGLIVVDCPIETVVERLVATRGLSIEEAEARIENQIPRVERIQLADYVIDNGGSLEALEVQIKRCWSWMSSFR